MTTTTDRIEKKVLLRAPRSRVWRALTDSTEFGDWFGVKFEEPFAEGKVMHGVLSSPEGRKSNYEGLRFEFVVDRIEPERLFSYRWHPFALDKNVDYSKEKSTLVVFTLDEAEGGVQLTVVETGFDSIPLERRAKAFASNDQGWTIQVTMIEKYLAHER